MKTTIFLWFSYGFPIKTSIFLWFSPGFPVVSPAAQFRALLRLEDPVHAALAAASACRETAEREHGYASQLGL
jgi:hypothetical protein